jgi:hypothetical protein
MGAVGYLTCCLLFLLLFFCTPIIGADIRFNTSMSAACVAPTGCRWSNHSIWVNNTIPGAEDNAIIEGVMLPNNSRVLIIIPLGDVRVDGLTVSKAELLVVDGTVEVRVLGLYTGNLIMGGYALMEVYSYATFVDGSNVTLFNTATLSVAMFNQLNGSYFELSSDCALTVYSNSSVWLYPHPTSTPTPYPSPSTSFTHHPVRPPT